MFQAATKDVTVEMLANEMVGHEVSFHLERKKQDAGETILSIENVKLLENASNTVSLDVHAGEILGIAGVEGNGQMQLEEMIMGLQKCKKKERFPSREKILQNVQRKSVWDLV